MGELFEPLTIYVGVTGHRNIPAEHIPALTAQVKRLLTELCGRYPGCAVTVLSPLADGADRLCARAALSTGCRLVAPLPMCADEYKKDFTAASTAEFDELCAVADRVFVTADTPLQGTPRGHHYRSAGKFVAEHCHILIALWDGREVLHPEGGGTYETICFARQAGCEVCIVPVPQPGEPCVEAACELPVTERLAALNELSADITNGGQPLFARAKLRESDLTDADSTARLGPGARRVLDVCMLADELSQGYSALKLRSLRLLSLLGLLLVLAFLLYDELEADLMLFFYAAFVVAAFAVHGAAARRRCHEKHIMYRATTEALRVQFYWGLCDIRDRASNCYTFTQRAALGCVDAVLLSLWEAWELPGQFGPPQPHTAVEYWVRRQHAYHTSSVKKKSARDAFHRRAERAALALALGLFVLVAAMELFYKGALEAQLQPGALRGLLLMHDGPIIYRGVLKIMLGTVSAGAAFLANYYGGLALPRQIFDSRRMAVLFEAALSADPAQGEQFTAAMHMLGREAMAECGGWYVAQYDNAPGLFIG